MAEPVERKNSEGVISKGSSNNMFRPRRILKKVLFKWQNMIPLHILIFSAAMMLEDTFLKCTYDMGKVLQSKSEIASRFVMEHPLDFSSRENFRESRANWHHEFDNLVKEVQKGFKGQINDPAYEGACSASHPVLFFMLDIFAICAVIFVSGFFVYQDTTTSFGASQPQVFAAVNILIGIHIVLGVINFPVLNLMNLAVKLSNRLEDCIQQLKAMQRIVVRSYDLDDYNLHASVWDGTQLGVRDPVLGYLIDEEFSQWIHRMLLFSLVVMGGLSAYLIYRASVKSLSMWRVAIPSVVCIGVVFPKSNDPNRLWRVGSGCVVSSRRGLVLTNWHLFQQFSSDNDVQGGHHRTDGSFRQESSGSNFVFGLNELNSPWRTNSDESKSGSKRGSDLSVSHVSNNATAANLLNRFNAKYPIVNDSNLVEEEVGSPDFAEALHKVVKKSHTLHVNTKLHGHANSMNDEDSLLIDEFGVPLNDPPPAPVEKHKKHRHLTHRTRYAESYSELYPEMKIYIGSATRGHPKWEYEAKLTGVESPSNEFQQFGLDLLVLKITSKIFFDKLVAEEEHGGNSVCTYRFHSMRTEPLTGEEKFEKFKIGQPYKLRSGDEKLRLLGFPASGGYSLSVLTGYFTSLSFDYAAKHRGAWLNVNVALPHGGSGGAAVNSKGELVGICTQTRGDLTNIRSITEALSLIEKAKRIADEEAERDNPVVQRQSSTLFDKANELMNAQLMKDCKLEASKNFFPEIFRKVSTTNGI